MNKQIIAMAALIVGIFGGMASPESVVSHNKGKAATLTPVQREFLSKLKAEERRGLCDRLKDTKRAALNSVKGLEQEIMVLENKIAQQRKAYLKKKAYLEKQVAHVQRHRDSAKQYYEDLMAGKENIRHEEWVKCEQEL